MFLAHFFPLSERSGTSFNLVNYYCFFWSLNCKFFTAVNIKGLFNTSKETKYEKDAPEGTKNSTTVLCYMSVLYCVNCEALYTS